MCAKQRIPRTRNANTMTESMFWSMIRSSLRQRTLMWKPIDKAKKLARRTYKGSNKRQRWEYQCAECTQWFKEKEVIVDHIVPAGSLRHYDDLAGFVKRLFCEVDGFQVLCEPCHHTKTQDDRKTLKTTRKKFNKKP